GAGTGYGRAVGGLGDPVQAYCDLLEVRWLRSEQAGRDVGDEVALEALARRGRTAAGGHHGHRRGVHRAATRPHPGPAGQAGPGHRRARRAVSAVHVAWSGNHRTVAERTPAAVSLLVGRVLLLPGEVRLRLRGAIAARGVYSDRLDALLSGRA